MSTLDDLEVRLAGGVDRRGFHHDAHGRFAPGRAAGSKLDAAGERRFVSHETGADAGAGKTGTAARSASKAGGLPKRGDEVQHGGTTHVVTGTRKVQGGADVYTTSGHKIHVPEGKAVHEGTKTGGGKTKTLAGGAGSGRSANAPVSRSSQSGRARQGTATHEQQAAAQASRDKAANRKPMQISNGTKGADVRPGDTVKAGPGTAKVKSVNQVATGHHISFDNGVTMHVPHGAPISRGKIIKGAPTAAPKPTAPATNKGKKVAVTGLDSPDHAVHAGKDYAGNANHHFYVGDTKVAEISKSSYDVRGTGSSAMLKVGSRTHYAVSLTRQGREMLGTTSSQHGSGRTAGDAARSLSRDITRRQKGR